MFNLQYSNLGNYGSSFGANLRQFAPENNFSSLTGALPRTCLSLHQFATILGINPVHFAGGYTDNVFPINSGCADVWPRYSWQYADRLSWAELTRAILDAENDIAHYLGYPPCPVWVCEEVQAYPQTYRPTVRSTDMSTINGHWKSVSTRWNKVTETGRRAAEIVELGTEVRYVDQDGDGFTELAVVMVTLEETHPLCQYKVYFADQSADARWEIRPAYEVDITGLTLTITFPSWYLVDPSLQSMPPSSGNSNYGIDLEDIGALVSTVDVYREYADDTAPSAALIYEPLPNTGWVDWIQGSWWGCTCTGACNCSESTVTARAIVQNGEGGRVSPIPASYNETTEQWDSAQIATRAPDKVMLWYKAGLENPQFDCGASCNPLSDYMATTIAMLATARLKRSMCGCDNELAEYWQQDISYVGADFSHTTEWGMLKNPFGTKVGEMQTFRRLQGMNLRTFDAGLI